ncbi:hypothetical protein [Pedobacter sp. L105]|uniref:hypothetical protein n=1 Tax=Pedobacter sp. L105 TaxID=1641871 RepID=UPI00131AC662|nr:hypothetical protein [Pedobacter sp. L105]
MKRISLLLLSVLIFHYGSYSQNTYPFPSTGNVGIGTTTPKALLDVNGQTNTKVLGLFENTNLIGYFGRAGSITAGLSSTPNVLALTYMQRDFAIAGWVKPMPPGMVFHFISILITAMLVLEQQTPSRCFPLKEVFWHSQLLLQTQQLAGRIMYLILHISCSP